MLTTQEVIELVGEDVFASIAAHCWLFPDEPDKLISLRQPHWDVVYEMVELVMELDGTGAERVHLLLSLYRRIPNYSLVSNFVMHYWNGLGADGRAAFWDEVRQILGGDDERLASPIEYALWCDFFEDEDVEEAWRALTNLSLEPRVIERALLQSAAVPFALKCEVYDQLIPLGRRWHPFVYQSVLRSEFAVMGKITKQQVHDTLARLTLRRDEVVHLDELEERVGSLAALRKRLV